MSLRGKLWLIVVLGAVAGLLDAWFDGDVKVFGYLRDAFTSALPAVIAARFLYEYRNKD